MSRRHEEATALLAGVQRLLPADAYSAYARVERENDQIIRVGCWAYARRLFHEALADAPVPAGFMLRLIGQLYAMEAQWHEAGWTEPAQRAHLRQRDFATPLNLLKKHRQDSARVFCPSRGWAMRAAFCWGSGSP